MSKKEKTEIQKEAIADDYLANAGDGDSLKANMTFDDLLTKGFETEEFVTMDEGDTILGFFLGKGATGYVKQIDRASGEETKRPVTTWRFKHPTKGRIMRILGSPLNERGQATYGLDIDLENVPAGVLVAVEKGEQTDIGGGRRTNRWRVAVNANKRINNVADYVKAPAMPPALAAHIAAPANGAQAASEAVPF